MVCWLCFVIKETGLIDIYPSWHIEGDIVNGIIDRVGMASRFEIDGSYEQGNGTMVISLADNNSKSQTHDSFIVEGDVELGGVLLSLK